MRIHHMRRARRQDSFAQSVKIRGREKCVCYMHIDGSDAKPGPWTIWLDGDHGCAGWDFQAEENVKETAWANLNYCESCGGSCSPGSKKTLFGREYEGVCSSEMAFTAPDTATMHGIKALLVLWTLPAAPQMLFSHFCMCRILVYFLIC